jgi:DNA methylase
MDDRLPLSVWPCAQQPARLQRRGRYVPESVAHPGKMVPEVARHAVSAYSAAGDLVLDPMCGIGTTLVESIHLGRRAIGAEYEPRWTELAEANVALAEALGGTGSGDVRVGDARNLRTLLPTSLRGRVALLLTSPPYGSSVHGRVNLLASGSPTAQSRLFTADVGLIHLHHPGQPVSARAHQHRAQPVQHRPRGLVGAHLQRPPQAQRRDAVLPVANTQHAVNHTVSGVRVRSKIVPAVTEVRPPQSAHMNRPSPSRQRGCSAGRRIHRASAATAGSPGSPHRSGTRPAVHRQTSGGGRSHEGDPLPEDTPVTWIPQLCTVFTRGFLPAPLLPQSLLLAFHNRH